MSANVFVANLENQSLEGGIRNSLKRLKIKILMITPEYPPYAIGGGGVVFKNIAAYMARKRYSITLAFGYYLTTSWFEKPSSYSSNGIKFIKLPLIPTPKSMPYFKTVMPPNIFSFFSLLKLLIQTDGQVQIHSYGHIITALATTLCRLLDRRYVFVIHGWPVTPHRRGGLLKLGYKVFSLTSGQFALKGASKIICISKSLINQIHDKSILEKTVVIPNGINLEEYRIKKGENTFSRKWKISDKAVTLFGMGRLHWSKGFQYLIEAMPLILEHYPTAVLVLAGSDDGYKADLVAKTKELGIENGVIFTGFLNLEEKKAAFHACDIFVIPSLDEPFGLIGLEAMAAGAPIISTRIGGLGEYLEDNLTALLVKPGDSQELAKKILYLLVDDKLQKALVQEAKRRAAKYAWDSIVEQYMKIHKDIEKETTNTKAS